jgi:hypothetical protein
VIKQDFDGNATTSSTVFLDTIMTGAGFVKDITTRTFTLSADFQVQPSEDAS